jgi:hypothetical protein
MRILTVADVVLLLMEEGQACRNVTGHQVCVLGEKREWPVMKPSRNPSQFSSRSSRVHMHSHTDALTSTRVYEKAFSLQDSYA